MHAITISALLAVAIWAGPIVGRAAESDASYFTGELTPVHRVIETTDARVSGLVSRTTNVDLYTISAPDSFLAVANSWRIENERGAWSGHSTGFAHFPDWDDLDRETAAETVVLTGEAGYLGLSAIMDVRSTVGGSIEVAGVVFRGEIPPLPEAPATTLARSAD